MRRILATGVGVSLLVLAACAQPTSNQPGDPGPGTYGPNDVVLRVEYVGGFVPVEHVVTARPLITVYGDGRTITEGPVIAIYPGPALPNFQVRTITPAGVSQLVNAAIQAGVGRTGVDYGMPPVADVPATVFTLRTNVGVLTTSVEALGIGEESLTPAQQATRAPLKNLLDSLQNLSGTLGGEAGEDKPYVPTALAAVSRPWVDPGEQDLPAPPEIVWPGPALPGESLGTGALGDMSCVTVIGSELDAVLAAAAWNNGQANTNTPWVSAGQRWFVTFRPLLPDESSCSDLAP